MSNVIAQKKIDKKINPTEKSFTMSTKKRIVKGNSYDVVKFDNLDEKLKSNYFSWNLRTSNGDLEVLWVAFSENGAICGDHSY